MQETSVYLHQLQCRRDKRGDADSMAAKTDAPGESIEALELRGGASDAPQVAFHPMLHEHGHVTRVQLHHGDCELDSVTADPRDGHAWAPVLPQDMQQHLHQCLLRHTCPRQARPQVSGSMNRSICTARPRKMLRILFFSTMMALSTLVAPVVTPLRGSCHSSPA